MIVYYKLFNLLNQRGLKKSDLRQILSSLTVSKLSKNEYVSGETINKICTFLNCQPADIMEVIDTKQEEFRIYRTENGKPQELIAIFYNLECAKDFINYQLTLKKSFIILQNGEKIY